VKECSYIVRDLGYLLAPLPAKFFEELRESNVTVAKHLWGTSPIHAPPRPGSEPARRRAAFCKQQWGIEHVDGPINIGIDRPVPCTLQGLVWPAQTPRNAGRNGASRPSTNRYLCATSLIVPGAVSAPSSRLPILRLLDTFYATLASTFQNKHQSFLMKPLPCVHSPPQLRMECRFSIRQFDCSFNGSLRPFGF
jgi:hypothetical protein